MMNNNLHKICLGTAQFASSYGLTNTTGGLSEQEISTILQLAKENGMYYLDTAPTYNDAEVKLGLAGVGDWRVITKVKTEKKYIDSINFTSSVYSSLERMKLQKIYGVLIHNPKLFFEPGINRLLEELSVLKNKGIINKIGVSVYDSTEVHHILSHFDIDIIQVPFNIIDARMLVDGTLSRLKQRNIEVHARSIYLQGLLLMPLKEQIRQFGKWESLWKLLDSFCRDLKISPLQACLRYALQQAEISQIIVGIDNYDQLLETVQSAKGEVHDIPSGLRITDENLCNPLNWEMYAHLRLS